MANPYELLGRERKVAKLVEALDATLGHPCTMEDLASLIDGQDQLLSKAYASAKIKAPSQETVNALVERIQERDAREVAR